jgi:Ran GTPase-activating protein (RanGAP) involved in mRNA processing and transport
LYNIPHKVKELQLADNKINGKGISLFRPLIELKLIRLKILNLENNQLKDKGTKIVLEVMAKCLTLKVLNLSKNEITDQSAKSIYNHIMQTKSLEILYLHWNLIKGGFGLSIVRAMQRN